MPQIAARSLFRLRERAGVWVTRVVSQCGVRMSGAKRGTKRGSQIVIGCFVGLHTQASSDPTIPNWE